MRKAINAISLVCHLNIKSFLWIYEEITIIAWMLQWFWEAWVIFVGLSPLYNRTTCLDKGCIAALNLWLVLSVFGKRRETEPSIIGSECIVRPLGTRNVKSISSYLGFWLLRNVQWFGDWQLWCGKHICHWDPGDWSGSYGCWASDLTLSARKSQGACGALWRTQ